MHQVLLYVFFVHSFLLVSSLLKYLFNTNISAFLSSVLLPACINLCQSGNKQWKLKISRGSMNYLYQMIYLTQLIYLKEGQEEVFHQFEDVAIPIILKYNGRLLLRIRPDDTSFVETSIDKPYEIHLVEFAADEDFQNFMKDEERKQFLHLKEQSIKAVILIKGTKI